ncbi:hypothetical protein M0P65_00155 [Candidatus Gracilibacteria bacterium]|nr:hypothetical protein [Candidatus Gracilibacteria bacterium]
MNTIGQKIASTRNKRSKEVGKIKEDLAKQVGSFAISKKYKNAVVKIIQMDLDFGKIAQNPENFFEENELKEDEIQEFVNGCKSISEKISSYNDKVRKIIKGQREETLENETEELKKLKNQEIEVKEMIASKKIKIGKLQAKLGKKPNIIEEKIVPQIEEIKKVEEEGEIISEKTGKTNIEIVSETMESGNINPRIRNKLLMRKLTLDEIIEDIENSEEFQKLIPITIDTKNKTVNLSQVKHPNGKGAIYKGLLLVSIFGKLGRDIGYELSSSMPKRDDAINILKQIFEKRGYKIDFTEIINEKVEKKETEHKEEKVEENGDTKPEKDISKEIIVENFRDDFFRFIKGKVEKIEGKYSINGELKYLLLLPEISKEVFLDFIKNLSESDKHELKLFYPLEADVLNLIDCLVQEKISYLRKIVKEKSQHKQEKISRKIEEKEKSVNDILNEYIVEFLENEEIDFLLSFLDESGKILGKIVNLIDQEEINKMEKNIEKVIGPYIYIKYLEKYREVFFELLVAELDKNIESRKLLKKSNYSRVGLIQIFNKYINTYLKNKKGQLQVENKETYEIYEKSIIRDYLFQKRIGIPQFIKEKCSDKYAAFSNLLITELNGEIDNEEEIFAFFLIAHEKDIKNNFMAHIRKIYNFGGAPQKIEKILGDYFRLNKEKLSEQLTNNKKHLIENFEKIEKILGDLRKDISPSGLSKGSLKKSQKNGKGSGINAVMVRGILDSYLEGFKNKAGLEDIKLDDDLIANFKDFINPTVTQFLSGFSKDSDLTSGKAGIANFFSEQKEIKTKKMLFVNLLKKLPDAIASLGGKDANFSNKLVEKIQEFNNENLPKIEENLKQIQEILDNLKVTERVKKLISLPY